MVDPAAYADVVAHLRRHSRRPLVAMELFTRLFSYLPPDGNEVLADRRELARITGCAVTDVSEIMGSSRPWAPSIAAARVAAFATSSTHCSAPT